ncbi:MAG: hypothetical protein WB780_16550 [Candidatus Acidiferrales bacterium]
MGTRIHAPFANFLVILFIFPPVQPLLLESHELSRRPPPAQFSTQPEIQVEIQISNERDTRIVLTNQVEEPLTAVYLQISYLSESRTPSKMGWDAFIQNNPPIAKNANVSLPLGHTPGVPFLGKVEVIAAVWASGTMFGPPDKLKYIFTNRAYQVRALDRLIPLLQTGLQEQWTREQYLVALDKMPDEFTRQALGLRSTLKVNPNFDAKLEIRRMLIQQFIDRFCAQREALRQSKPDFTAPYIPN